jgi:hypothetical protein
MSLENSDHTISFYTGKKGEPRISVDAPGVAAVSAPVGDPMNFVTVAANQLGLEVDDSTLPDSIVVSVPAGA